MTPAPVLTLDGPGGAGKGTVARAVARELGWHLLDSGAIYRLLALAAERAGVDVDDVPGLLRVARGMRLEFRPRADGGTEVRLDGEEVSTEIRSEACGERASRLAVLPAVREALLARQRDFREPPGLVADGRDMGTVVFPDAEVKVFLTASAEERARRRHKQLKEQGLGGNLTDLLREITARDERDANREVAPLVPAGDAVTIDTTGVPVESVVAQVMSRVRERLGR
ncbi:(d)CMP kinase [Spiribacter halobius]|uniref:Cytidylate kinase n=1 Tax=Sediminicurvatus halobius TaxID=2182432 RepID=A0A2U2N3C3_9GAMM|nr:(d)CMP kinase [Spiribacter halobius]PWG63469.1 (d)CMP kinase [Spiribacter halobius]UEX79660.1 (d)CMP kinase [Spiribacter halobius]